MPIIRILICLALSITKPLMASEYKVELLVFTQNPTHTEQLAPLATSLTIPDDVIDLAPEGTLGQDTLVEAALKGLSRTAAMLEQQPGYALLLRMAWKQKITPHTSTPAIRLQDNNGRLRGFIKLSEEHGLKVNLGAELTAEENASSAEIDEAGMVYQISQQRKIKAGEPYYFDHPKFGMVLLATDLAPPAPRIVKTPTAPKTSSAVVAKEKSPLLGVAAKQQDSKAKSDLLHGAFTREPLATNSSGIKIPNSKLTTLPAASTSKNNIPATPAVNGVKPQNDKSKKTPPTLSTKDSSITSKATTNKTKPAISGPSATLKTSSTPSP